MRSRPIAMSALLLFLAACGGGADSGGPVSPPPGGTQTAGTSGMQVKVVDIAFNPSEIRVKVGAKVSWVWQGNLPHSVTADDKSFDSDVLQKGASFEQTFTKSGRVEYFCKVHSSAGGTAQNGVIIVE